MQNINSTNSSGVHASAPGGGHSPISKEEDMEKIAAAAASAKTVDGAALVTAADHAEELAPEASNAILLKLDQAIRSSNNSDEISTLLESNPALDVTSTAHDSFGDLTLSDTILRNTSSQKATSLLQKLLDHESKRAGGSLPNESPLISKETLNLAVSCNLDCLPILLEFGADAQHIDLTDILMGFDQNTNRATIDSFKHVCDLLKDKRVDFDCSSNPNRTPLLECMIMAFQCHRDGNANFLPFVTFAKTLTNFGANVNYQSPDGYTPFSYVIGVPPIRENLLDLFLEHGGDLNTPLPGLKSKSPLEYSAKKDFNLKLRCIDHLDQHPSAEAMPAELQTFYDENRVAIDGIMICGHCHQGTLTDERIAYFLAQPESVQASYLEQLTKRMSNEDQKAFTKYHATLNHVDPKNTSRSDTLAFALQSTLDLDPASLKLSHIVNAKKTSKALDKALPLKPIKRANLSELLNFYQQKPEAMAQGKAAAANTPEPSPE